MQMITGSGEITMMKRNLLLTGAVLAFAFAFLSVAHCDDTNMWAFTNALHYRVSDTDEIEVADGVAKLKLRAVEIYETTIPFYLGDNVSRNGVRVGPAAAVGLVQDGSAYRVAGTYMSRVFDGGPANEWQGFINRVANRQIPNSGDGLTASEPDIVSLLPMDNSWADLKTGQTAWLTGNPQFIEDAMFGSHGAEFDGNDAASMKNSSVLNGKSACTIAFWIKLTEYTTYTGILCSRGGAGPLSGAFPFHGFATGNPGGKLQFYVNTEGISITGVVLDLNKWYFITGTWSPSGGRKIYLDGELNRAVSGPAGTIQQLDEFRLCWDDYDWTRFSKAALDEVAIFDEELTESQVRSLYLRSFSAKFQIRSSTIETNFLSDFVGPDGDTSTFFTREATRVVPGGGFEPTDRYVQYKVDLSAAYDGSVGPLVDTVAFVGDKGTETDYALGDFLVGDFGSDTTNYPTRSEWSSLEFARKPNGGYYTNGTFTSRVLDSGSVGTDWDEISWDLAGQGLSVDLRGLMGLWSVDGSWADVTVNGNSGVPEGGVAHDDISRAKLGPGASSFNGIDAFVRLPDMGILKTVEFWINNRNVDDGVMSFMGTNAVPYLAIVDGRIEAVGFNSYPTVYVNGSAATPRMLNGWNHVAVVVGVGFDTTNFVVGAAQGDLMEGMIDEMAAYDRELDAGEVMSHYAGARPHTAGTVWFRARAADSLPALATATWKGKLGLVDEYYLVPEGSAMDGIHGQYAQYRAYLFGDGNATPAFASVEVRYSGTETYEDDTPDEFHAGTFDEDKTWWYGDDMSLPDLSASGPVNLLAQTLTSAAGIWHMDEDDWPGGLNLEDASGNGRWGVPANGAIPVEEAKVGLKSGFFDGANDFVTLSGVGGLLSDDDFTVCIWFKTEDSARCAAFSSYDGNKYFTLEINGDGTGANVPGQAAFIINDDTGAKFAASMRTNLNDDRWHHIAGVRRGDYIHLYVDGEREADEEIGPLYDDLGLSGVYLAKYGSDAIYFDGLLDEAAIFLSALLPEEIGELAGAGVQVTADSTFTGSALDATRPSIWQKIWWGQQGLYGGPLMPDDTSLAALWHMDESSGTIEDASSSGNNDGSHNGGYGADGVFSNALVFDGSDDRVQVGDDGSLNPPEGITVEAWVYPEDLGSSTIINKQNGIEGYALAIGNDGRPYFWIQGRACTNHLALYADEWSHVAGTYDGQTLRLYVNGEHRAMAQLVGGDLGTGSPLLIGESNTGGGNFEGMMDEVAVHRRALEPEEVVDHYRLSAVTLGFRGRAGNTNDLSAVDFIGPDGGTNSFFTTWAGSTMTDIVPLGRYFQYRAYLNTRHHRLRPILRGVRIDQSSYSTIHPYVEPEDGYGYPFPGDLLAISHSLGFAGPGTEVMYQLSGDNGVTWHYWDGVQWAEAIGLPYPAERSYMAAVNANIGEFFDQVYPKTGGTFKFRAFVHSLGDYQFELDQVDLAASEGRVIVTVPNGEENGDKAWLSKVPYDIEWTWTGNVSANLVIQYTLDGPDDPSPTWVDITTTAPRGAGGVGSFSWTTPQAVLETNVLVRITDPNDDSISDVSDAPFTIIRRFRIVTPNGGEKWYLGKTNNIVWESSYDLGSLSALYYAADGSNFDYEITFTTPNVSEFKANTYPWETPTTDETILSTNARIKVKKPTGTPSYEDASDGTFMLAGVVITEPTAGRKISRGTPFDIEWHSAAAGDLVAIDLSSDAGATFTNTLFTSVTNVHGFNTHTWIVQELGTDLAVLRIRSLSDGNAVGHSPVFTIGNVDVLAPTNGAVWLMNTTNMIRWTSGGAGPEMNLYYSTDAGVNWTPFADNPVPNTDSNNWTVTHEVSIQGRIKVESAEDTNLWNQSELFNIAGVRVLFPDLQAHELVLDAPYWFLHDAAPEAWQGAKLEISYDQENTWLPLHTNWNLGDPFQFTPDYPSRQTKVKISVNESSPYTNVYDTSDFYFTVAGVLIDEPSTGSLYNIGFTHPIKWITAGADEFAHIYYSSGGDFVRITPPLGVNNDLVYPGQNTWNWDVDPTLVPSIHGRIKVESAGYEDISPEFTLRGIRIDIPDTNTVWDVGSAQVVHWVVAGIDSSARASIDLSLDGGATFPYNLTNDYPLVDVDFLFWNIDPDYDPTVNAMLRTTITSSGVSNDVGVTANSDLFTLKGVKVLTPAAGGNWQLETTRDITFIAAGAGSSATISYSPNGGSSYDPDPVAVFAISNGLNTYSWAIETDREPSANALIRVAGSEHVGYSAPFILGGIKVLRPLKFDIWAVGETNIIQWISVGTEGTNTLTLHYEGGGQYEITNGYVGTMLNWLVVSNAVPGGIDTASNVILRVEDTGPYDGYSEPFKIVSTPRIEIIAPASGEFWKVGNTEEIKWIRGGQMRAEDFRVFFSKDDFATMDEVYGTVTFNTSNNTFSMPWFIPNRLGTKKALVTNVVNSLLLDVSGEFDIVGNFEVNFPNGAPGEEDMYAKNTYSVSWFTRGSVGFVDLYYKYGTNDWEKINTTPIVDNATGVDPQLSGTTWTLPDIQSDTVLFRVQDSDYTQIFDGVTPGPYDDSDSQFEIKYYDIWWLVGYTNSPFHPLDGLTIRDTTLGVSQSGLSCIDPNGDPQYIAMKYPYGQFTTEWFREFYARYVDFDWLCNSNMVRVVIMEESEIEPDPEVMADFSYDIATKVFTMQTWMEQGGHILSDPDAARVIIYNQAGDEIAQVSSTTHNMGVFWMNWDASAFAYGETFFAWVEVDIGGATYESGRTIHMRQAASAEIEAVLSTIDAAASNIIGEVSGVGTNVSAVGSNVVAMRGEVSLGMSNLTEHAETASNLLEDVTQGMGILTNEMRLVMETASNVLVSVHGSASNIVDIYTAVSNMNVAFDDDLARILTRPTTVPFGTTNTILYKTRRGYDPSTVQIEVFDPAQTSSFEGPEDMNEIGVGIGIYRGEITADWGIGSFLVRCTDAMARDSMIIEVTAEATEVLAPMMLSISNRLDDMQNDMTNVAALIQTLGDFDTGAVSNALIAVSDALDALDIPTNLADVVATLEGLNLGVVTQQISQIQQTLDGMVFPTNLPELVESLERFDLGYVSNAIDLANAALGTIPTNLNSILDGINQSIVDLNVPTNLPEVVATLEALNMGVVTGDIAQIKQSLLDLQLPTNLTDLVTSLEGLNIEYVSNRVDEINAALQQLNVGFLSNALEDVSTKIDALDFPTNLNSILDGINQAVLDLDIPTNLPDVVATLEGLNLGVVTTQIGQIQQTLDGLVFPTNLPELVQALESFDLGYVSNRVDEINSALQSMDLGYVSNAIDQANAALQQLNVGYVSNALDQVNATLGLLNIPTNLNAVLDTINQAIIDLDIPTNLPQVVATLEGLNMGIVTSDIAQIKQSLLDLKLPTNLTDLVTSLDELNLDYVSNRVDEINAALLQLDLGYVSNTVEGIQTTLDQFDLAFISNTLVNINALFGSLPTNELAALSNTVAELQGAAAAVTGLQTTVVDVQTTVNAILAQVQTLGQADIGTVETGIDDLKGMVQALADAVGEGPPQIDLTTINRIESFLGTVQDSVSENTFFGQLARLSDQLDSVGGIASDASDNALKAKSEAQNVAQAVQQLSDAFAAGNLVGAGESLIEIRQGLAEAQRLLSQVPKFLGIDQLQDEIATMAATIQEFAASQGYDMLLNLEQIPVTGEGVGLAPGEEPTAEANAEAIAILNQNIEELRAAIELILKLLEPKEEEIIEFSESMFFDLGF